MEKPLVLDADQLAGVDFLAKRKTALLADHMGYGKTPQAIRAADKIQARTIIVVTPVSGMEHWRREFAKWGIGGRVCPQMRTGVGNFVLPDNQPVALIVPWSIVADETVLKQITAFTYDLGIFDESQYASNDSAARTCAIYAKGGVAKRCKRVWCLSGTPMRNHPGELYPMLRVLYPQE